MKTIKQYIDECGATPMTTTGMGNPVPPTETQPGSEPLPTAKIKRKKKKVEESLLDDSLEDNLDKKIEICEWLVEHSKLKSARKSKSYKEDIFNAIKVNNDGSFDLLESDTWYDFEIREELPSNIRFNVVHQEINFYINCPGKKFTTIGFPKSSAANRAEDNSISITAVCKDFVWAKGTIDDFWTVELILKDSDSAILDKGSNVLDLKLLTIGDEPNVYDIPRGLQNLYIEKGVVEKMLKNDMRVSWGTKVLIK